MENIITTHDDSIKKFSLLHLLVKYSF
ncbi:hypothetical protein [Aquimarina aquimarini]